MARIGFIPGWGKFEKDMHNPDNKIAEKATDNFLDERERETHFSRQAREWEKSRKESYLKDKPRWKKEKLAKEQEPMRKLDEKLKNIGSFESGMKPAPGYLLIEPRQTEEKTSTGIYLAKESDGDNIGTVLEVGNKLFCKHCFVSLESQPTEPPAKKGDKVLYKRNAGINLDIKGKKCKIMMFSDLLALFD